MIDELVSRWYNELYQPALDLYAECDVKILPVFYMRWMQHRQQQVLTTVRKSVYAPRIRLEESLEAYLASNVRKP